LDSTQVEDLFERAVADWTTFLEDDDTPEDAEWDINHAGRILWAEHGSEEPVIALMEDRLYHPASEARQIAALVLWEAASKGDASLKSRVARSLGEAIKLEGDPVTLAKMLYYLSYNDAPNLEPLLDTLVSFVDHHDDYVRDRLADVLSAAGSRPEDVLAIDALMQLAADDNDEVRWSAVFELSARLDWVEDGEEIKSVRDAEIRSLLGRIAQSDQSEKIRETAGEYL
jgi:hypothetical protein